MHELLLALAERRISIDARDGKLHVQAPPGALTRELQESLSKHKDSLIRHLTSAVNRGQSEVYVQIIPDAASRHAPFPLNSVQHAYWIGRSKNLELGGTSTHVYWEFDCEMLDSSRLSTGLRKVIERHDMLRAVVDADGTQRTLVSVPDYQICEYDLRDQGEAERVAKLSLIRSELSHQVIPCDRWPLFDIRVAKMTPTHSRLYMSWDFLTVDAWSILIIFREWHRFYEDRHYDPPPLALAFRDYVLAENRLRELPAFELARNYWMNRIDSLPGAPLLPQRSRLEAGKKYEFTRRSIRLAKSLWSNLRDRGRLSGITVSNVLLSAFAEIIGHWSKSNHFCLNLTLFNRLPLHKQASSIVGDFTNLLIVEIDGSRGANFTARAMAIQNQFLQDLENRQMGAVEVMREMSRRRSWDQRAAFPIVFTSTLMLDGSRGESSHTLEVFGPMTFGITQTPQVSLDCQVFDFDGELVINWDTAEEVFEPGVLDDMFDSFHKLLVSLANDGGVWDQQQVVSLPLGQEARRTMVNDTTAVLFDQCLQSAFIARAISDPMRVAIEQGGRRITYGELLTNSNRLAQRLIKNGVKTNQLVAVLMNKGPEQVVAVLAILIAGAAYLPIDLRWPPLRRNRVLSDGEVRVGLISTREDQLAEWPDDIERLAVSADPTDDRLSIAPPVRQAVTDLAYVIYTSGSTGSPKGVMIDHRGAVNTVVHINRIFGAGGHDKVLAVSDLSFDLSVYDIFGMLSQGATIVMPEAALTRDPAHWHSLIEASGVTIWNSAPQLMGMLVDWAELRSDRRLPSLRLILLSGDWIPTRLPERIKALSADSQVISLGGATECSIWSIYFMIEAIDPAWRSIPYGRPLPNQRTYVLDSKWRPCPEFVVGDIYIGGVGVALGYWKDEEKSRKHFVRNPITDERLYFTGDKGRYLADGQIEFLGREDSQIKLRGNRVELGEIASTLQGHEDIKEANVRLVTIDAASYLVAYVVPARREQGALFATKSMPVSISLECRERVFHAATAQVSAALAAPSVRVLELRRIVDAASASSMVDALGSLGLLDAVNFDDHLGALVRRGKVKRQFAPLLSNWLRILESRGIVRKQLSARFTVTAHDVRELGLELNVLREYCRRDSELHELGEFLVASLRNQLALLSGDLTLAGLKLPAGPQLVNFIRDTQDHLSAAAVKCFGAVVGSVIDAAKEHIRVIEIGLGTGVYSLQLLPLLPADRSEFVRTDATDALFHIGQDVAAAFPSVASAVLDINLDPKVQGHQPHSYDIIIVSNPRCRFSEHRIALEHMRELLRPGGFLLIANCGLDALMEWAALWPLDAIQSSCTSQTGSLLDVWTPVDWISELRQAGFCPLRLDLDGVSANGFSEAFPRHNHDHVIVAQGPDSVRVFDPGALTEYLGKRLPEYMIPQRYSLLERLPLGANGKVDTEMLARAVVRSYQMQTANALPQTDGERQIWTVWKSVLHTEAVRVTDNFFEVGGDSLRLVEVLNKLNAVRSHPLTIEDLLTYPTVRSLAEHLSSRQTAEKSSSVPPSEDRASVPDVRDCDVAIIGMAGRFPNATDVKQLWSNIASKKCSVREFTDEELTAAGVSRDLLTNPRYVKAGVVLPDIDLFDAAYFDIAPADARIMDPQQRMLLECAIEAIDHAGYQNEKFAGRIGVFVGKGTNFYMYEHVACNAEVMGNRDLLSVLSLNEPDFSATMLSYKLNLTGPSVNVSTACSTSLVAVHMACQSLLNDPQCEVAIAGGVTLSSTLSPCGYLYSEGLIASPDGYCRAFADDANGCVFGSGVGLVVLKPLHKALSDGDTVHAVIKGSAINNDGSLKLGYAAPSVSGQAQVIREALRRADATVDSIQYVEAHGTGTPLGDPMEFAALRDVFGGPRVDGTACVLGSIKSNIGHLGSAAGVAGLIKVVLSLKHRKLPPTLHASVPSRRIDLNDSPFYLNSQLSDWQAGPGRFRRASVSSFGFGGTNAHVVVQEAPLTTRNAPEAVCQLIVLSGRTETALRRSALALANSLQEDVSLELSDVAFTLQVGRRAHEHRSYIVCSDVARAQTLLDLDSLQVWEYRNERTLSIVFMIPGELTTPPRISRRVYLENIVFKEAFDKCAEIIRAQSDFDIRQLLLEPNATPAEKRSASMEPGFANITAARAFAFSVGYALASFWISLGVKPTAMLGHGTGEYVVACLAGIFSLEAALRLLDAYARLHSKCPSVRALAISCTVRQLAPILSDLDCSISAVNGPEHCVASGKDEAICTLGNRLDALGIVSKALHGARIVPSALTQSVRNSFEAEVSGIDFRPPTIPYVSSVTGNWLSNDEATSSTYWVRQALDTVQFETAITRLAGLDVDSTIALEVGWGGDLIGHAQACIPKSERLIATFDVNHDGEISSEALLDCIGKLWVQGVDIDWMKLHQGRKPRRVPLPSYPFERNRHWIDRPAATHFAPDLESERQTYNKETLASEKGHARISGIATRQVEEEVSHATQSGLRMPNEIQTRLIEIWEGALGVHGIGIDDNFFELGGDSLMATRVFNGVKAEFGVELPIRNMFEFATVRQLALYVTVRRTPEEIDNFSEFELKEVLAMMGSEE